VVNAYNYSDATGTIGAPLWGPIAIAATPTFFGMDQMALNPANNRLYVSQPGSLDIYNPATGGFIASILDPNIQTATGICFPSTNVIEVDIDIKFCSNPNGYNCKSRGVTPVTIFGTQDFDASDIIVSTAMLCLADDLDTCTALAPKDSSVADRGDPTTDIGAAQCTVIDGVEQDFLNPDGETDLDIAFHTQDVVNLIGCDTLSKGDASPTLVLIGETNDGSLITSVPIGDVGVDQLLIQKN
jgi:hypothetical protein